MQYVVYGAGTPIRVEAYSPEVAEGIVVEQTGVSVERLKAVREDNVVLPGDSVSGCAPGTGLHSNSLRKPLSERQKMHGLLPIPGLEVEEDDGPEDFISGPGGL